MLYRLASDPAFLLSHSQRKGWIGAREKEEEKWDRGRDERERETERERDRGVSESQIHCCPDTTTGPREIDHTLALTHTEASAVTGGNCQGVACFV